MDRPRLAALTCTAALAAAAFGVPASLAAAPAPSTATTGRHVAGDFDGDGRTDLAIGAPGGNTVRVHLTRSGTTITLHPGHPSVVPMRFGAAVAAGDFNSDGFADLAIGAPDFEPPGQTGGLGNPTTQGAIFEFRGSATGLHPRVLRLLGPFDGDEPFDLGGALAAADVNGDGKADLAATLDGADTGNLPVYFGTATGLTMAHEEDLNDFQVESIAFGDVNGDRRPDLIAGATVNLVNDAGDILVFTGTTTGRLKRHPQLIRGESVHVRAGFGAAVATGDVNGDGITDVIVGGDQDIDRNGHFPGSIVVLPGSPHGISAARFRRISETVLNAGSSGGDRFGATLAVARFGTDRFADVVVGAPGATAGAEPHAGAVYVLHGSATGLRTGTALRISQASAGVPGAAAPNGHFGAAVMIGNLAGSAARDLAVGAPGPHSAAAGGLVVTLRGAAHGPTTAGATSVADPAPHHQFGAAIG
jgi:hypothetical protein